MITEQAKNPPRTLKKRDVTTKQDYFEHVEGNAQIFTGPVYIFPGYSPPIPFAGNTGITTDKDPLGEDEESLLKAIGRWIFRSRELPTIEDIKVAYPAFRKTFLDQLRAEGYLFYYDDLQPRIITLTESAQEYLGQLGQGVPNILPLISGGIAGKEGGNRFKCPGSYVEAPTSTKEGCFAVEAEGNSMEKAGIHDKDKLIIYPVKPGERPFGKVVLAWYNGQRYIKRLKHKNGKIILHSESETTYEDILIEINDFEDSNKFKVEGIVLQSFREVR